MKKSGSNFVFSNRKRLAIAFIIIFAVLGGIAGLIIQTNRLPVPVMIFGGILSGGLLGLLIFVCLLALLDIHTKNK
jgi:hypothetical protein